LLFPDACLHFSMTAERCTSCVTSASAKPDDNFVHLHLRARVTRGLDPFSMVLALVAIKKA
jgi:hypothetical protein